MPPLCDCYAHPVTTAMPTPATVMPTPYDCYAPTLRLLCPPGVTAMPTPCDCYAPLFSLSNVLFLTFLHMDLVLLVNFPGNKNARPD